MAMNGDLHLHPLLDQGIRAGTGSFAGGTLTCRCPQDKVEVRIEGDVAFNHACGCTKCWKPAGSLFSVVAVVPRDKLQVTTHAEKLQVVDPAAAIQRHACKACGVHMYGRIENKDHPFYGFDFIHPELFAQLGAAPLRPRKGFPPGAAQAASTPIRLATCVEIASISGGDRQS